MLSTVITLAKIAPKLTMLEIACTKCDRYGRLSVTRLIAEHGEDMALPELKEVLAADCPRQRATSLYDRCGAYYPQLPRLFGQR